MNAPDRDRALDRLLRQPDIHGGRGRGDDCPDAETLAAWMDGGLDAASAALAESHMSGCARCQALVATMVRAESAESVHRASSVPVRVPWWRVNLRWLAPLAAGATAAVLWTIVPEPRSPTQVPVSEAPVVQPARPQESPTPSQAADAGGFAPPAQPGPPKREDARADLELKRREQNAGGQPAQKVEETVTVTGRSPTVETARAAPAPAPPAPVPAEPARDASPPAAPAAGFAFRLAAPVEISTPDVAIRWRIARGALERTADGGQTWVGVETGDPASLVAGAAPTTTVVWLVGRGGAVLLTTDARTWRRVTAPSTSDLVAVSATDNLNAVVRTADGQMFRTADGGAMWVASPVP